ncbi:MAG: hypothetical protein QNK37_22080, partial [Acidobacteriota bacterium]|nr:hypothetical protein [Acidobacteriota bacterium]
AGGGGFGHAGKPVNVDPVAQGGGAGTVNGPGAGGIGHNPQHSQGGDGGAGFGGGGGSHKQGGGGGGGFQGGAGSASNNGAAQGGLSFVNVGVNGATVVNQASGGDGQGQGADGRVIIN